MFERIYMLRGFNFLGYNDPWQSHRSIPMVSFCCGGGNSAFHFFKHINKDTRKFVPNEWLENKWTDLYVFVVTQGEM